MSSHVQTINVDNASAVVNQPFAAMTINANGNYLVVNFRTGSGLNATHVTISDNLGLSWSPLYDYNDGFAGPNGDSVEVWWALVGSNGGQSITVTVDWTGQTSASARGFLSEFTGQATSSPQDVLVAHNEATAQAQVTSNTGSPASPGNEMLICYFEQQSSGSSAFTAGLLGAAGGTSGTIPSGGTHTRGGIMYNAVATTNSCSGKWTWTTNNNASVVMYGFTDAVTDILLGQIVF